MNIDLIVEKANLIILELFDEIVENVKLPEDLINK